MRRIFGSLVAICIVMSAASFAWKLRHHAPIPGVTAPVIPAAPAATADHPVEYDEEIQARQMVTLTGPLADYIAHQDPGQLKQLGADSEESGADSDESSAPRPFNPADHVGDSPVGTSTPILKKTFTIARAVDLPFEIPPHAATPQLRGTYTASVGQGGKRTGAEAAVQLLLMNEEQYKYFLDGHPPDALFSVESGDNQEVNTSMPPTVDQPVRYYLVFCNDSRRSGKVLVRADFRIDF